MGLWFMLSFSAIGLLVGIPLGAIAGWRIGKGRKPNARYAAGGAVVLSVVFSLPLRIQPGDHGSLVVLLPLFGLISGAVLGIVASVFSRFSRDG